MKSLLRAAIARSVLQKGLRGGSSFWLAVGALSMVRRMFDRKAKRSESITLTERIRPGDELTLRYPGAPARKTRKEIAKAAQRRTEEAQAKRLELDRLERKAGKRGLRARGARKALEALRSSR